jgi:hypothetical protein
MTMSDRIGFAALLSTVRARLNGNAQGYDGYVAQLSQRLYRETLGGGGWAVDAGVLGPDHYRVDAQRMVHEIALGSAIGDVPSP